VLRKIAKGLRMKMCILSPAVVKIDGVGGREFLYPRIGFLVRQDQEANAPFCS
jgi:hypothetical protein